MASETIVAVFDTAAHADAAIQDLVSSGIPQSSIEHYARDGEMAGGAIEQPVTEKRPHGGLWGWLTGSFDNAHEHHALYDQTIHEGGTIVTVIAEDADIAKIDAILDRHDPIDLDDRHTRYQASNIYGSQATGAGVQPFGTQPLGVAATDTTGTSTEEVIALAEEELVVGKREVDRGTTRVRRYTVERPVEEQIRLRNETVSIFRRPVNVSTAVGADAFTDREIVVNETDEEVVVGKTAHVVEEVVVQKGVQKGVEERVETIHDTVRRETVEIDGPAGTPAGTAPATTGSTGSTGRTPGI